MRKYAMFILMISWGLAGADEPCHVLIQRDELQKKTIDGVDYYAVPVETIKTADCFRPKQTIEYIKNLQAKVQENVELAEAIKKTADKQRDLNQEYSKLLQTHEKTLDRSVDVASKFAENSQKYHQLIKDYDSLVVKFDLLAGKYRDVAVSAGDVFRVDVGGGVANAGGAVGLVGVGMNVYRQWGAGVWGVFSRDSQSVLGGASFRF